MSLKVKIGSVIYDAEDQPIMLILDDVSKGHIQDMASDGIKYCVYPENTSEEIIIAFMANKEEGNA